MNQTIKQAGKQPSSEQPSNDTMTMVINSYASILISSSMSIRLLKDFNHSKDGQFMNSSVNSGQMNS